MNGKLKWLLFRNGLYTELRARKNKWPGEIHIGEHFSIGKGSVLDRYRGGSLTLLDGVTVCQHCKIATCGGDLLIGENSVLGDYTTITAQGGKHW